VEESLWESRIRKDASEEAIGPCNRAKERVCAKKGKGVLTIKRGERGGTGLCGRSIEEELHQAMKVTTNLASALCGKKGWCRIINM